MFSWFDEKKKAPTENENIKLIKDDVDKEVSKENHQHQKLVFDEDF